jgi:amino acid adenylation domain-containing protein
MPDQLRAEEQSLLEDRLQRAMAGNVPAPSIPRRPPGRPAKLSFAQTRLWFFDQLLPRSPLYNIVFASRLGFPVDVRILKRSLQHIVSRHDVLRTGFSTVDDEPVQNLLGSVDVPLSPVDLRRLPSGRREQVLTTLAARLHDEPFDLRTPPLLRALIAWLGPADYVLVIVIHHIVADGWSLGVFARELESSYRAYARADVPRLPSLPIQYADFAAWQRDRMTGPLLEAEVAYWRDQLADLPQLELPADRPRPPVQLHRGADVAFAVPAPLVAKLGRLARERGATLFMVALAGFDLVLSRWAGATDVVVGAPIANRNRAEIEGLIGFFVNTLVLRVDLSGNPTFDELLGRVRAVALAAYAHQDLPFEKLVEELRPERDLSRNPLVQVIFQLFEAADPGMRALETGISIPSRTSLFDLRVDLAPARNGLSGRIEYDVELFDQTTIEQFVGRYLRVLEQVADDPSRSIGSYELLTDEEHKLLGQWNGDAVPVPGVCVHELFSEVAGRLGERVAVVDGDGEHSFGVVEERSNQLAHHLMGLGVGVGDLVGVCLGRDVLLVVALLGVLKCGAAFVPLEPDLPSDRLRFMVEDAGVGVVLTRSELAGVVPPGPRVVALDRDWPETAPVSGVVSGVGLSGDAWVLYTSGSTGAPKGVRGSHGGLVNRLSWGWQARPFAEDEVCCLKTRLGFVDSVWELFGPLVAGVRLVVVPEDVVGDAVGLVELLVREGVTRLVVVPSLLSVLVDVAGERLRASRLAEVACSGEALSGELVRRFRAVLPGCRLVNLYGSTEVAADATCYVVEDEVGDRVPIGRPLQNMWVRVLGRAGELVPVGAVGELCVGGAGVSPGYVGHAAGQQERFIADPLAGGGRLYRTGDLGRWRRDGLLEYAGRRDRQVKVRGVRVEPEEVEQVLGEHPDVREAAVVAREGADGTELVGFLVAADGSAPTDAVRAYLHTRLPDQMIPAHLIPIDQLPRLPNGKTDRTTLTEKRSPDAVKRSYDAPVTAEEQAVAEVFAELTGAGAVGRDDDFFALGGHSLLATRAVSRLSAQFERALPLQLLFEHPTVAGLARAISKLPAAYAPDSLSIARLDRERFRTSGSRSHDGENKPRAPHGG